MTKYVLKKLFKHSLFCFCIVSLIVIGRYPLLAGYVPKYEAKYAVISVQDAMIQGDNRQVFLDFATNLKPLEQLDYAGWVNYLPSYNVICAKNRYQVHISYNAITGELWDDVYITKCPKNLSLALGNGESWRDIPPYLYRNNWTYHCAPKDKAQHQAIYALLKPYWQKHGTLS